MYDCIYGYNISYFGFTSSVFCGHMANKLGILKLHGYNKYLCVTRPTQVFEGLYGNVFQVFSGYTVNRLGMLCHFDSDLVDLDPDDSDSDPD